MLEKKSWQTRINEAREKGEMPPWDLDALCAWSTCLVGEALAAKGVSVDRYTLSASKPPLPDPLLLRLLVLGTGTPGVTVGSESHPAALAKAGEFDLLEARLWEIQAVVEDHLGRPKGEDQDPRQPACDQVELQELQA